MATFVREKRCPYLKEVVMIFCDGYPIKKLVPLDRITTASLCFGDDFGRCALYAEITSRAASAGSREPSAVGERRRRRRGAADGELTPRSETRGN